MKMNTCIAISIALLFLLVSGGCEDNRNYTTGEGRDRETRLHRAAWNGDLEKVKKIVATGTDVDCLDGLGATPLVRAVNPLARGDSINIELVEFLISKGADVNSDAVVHAAAIGGNVEVVKLLVSKGANVNVKNEDGKTPLDIARERRNVKVVEYLSGIR